MQGKSVRKYKHSETRLDVSCNLHKSTYSSDVSIQDFLVHHEETIPIFPSGDTPYINTGNYLNLARIVREFIVAAFRPAHTP